MDVLFVCGREPEYVRNRLILKALRRHGSVIEITDRSKNYVMRHVRLFIKLLTRIRKHDALFVGFYGYPLVFAARLFSRRPIVFDALVSTYDTLCFDRRTFTPRSILGRLVFWMDAAACRLSDVVMLDTRAHLDYFVETYRLPAEKFVVLYVGCDEELFSPRSPPSEDPFIVFYYCSYLPVHGIEHVVRAAKLLENESGITFRIAGSGARYAEIHRLSQVLRCGNIEFVPWIPFERLPEAIAQASLCLGGHFSESTKAQNVIASKTFQLLAMGKPTIVGANRANSEIFTHGEHVYMCRMGDPQSLADAVVHLRNRPELREKIASGGYSLFAERYGMTNISNVIERVLSRVHAPLPCQS